MHPTRSTSILISLATVAACVVPVIAGQKPADPQAKKPSTATHGPTATTTPAKQDPAKTKTAATAATKPPAPATAAKTDAKAGTAKAGTAKAADAKSSAPKAASQSAAATAKQATGAAAKTTTPAAAKTTAAKAAPAGAPKPAETKPAPAATASAAANTKKSPAPPTPSWTPDNPVAEKLAAKPAMLARTKSVVPADTDLNNATAGFKNLGQFVAAVNVSKNVGIPFADLKANLTGVKLDGQPTGKPVLSLGGAIRILKADADPMGEAQRATADAEAEVGESAAAPPRTATATTAAKAPTAGAPAPAPTGAAKTPKKPVGQSANATR
jgi:hypothetical protein